MLSEARQRLVSRLTKTLQNLSRQPTGARILSMARTAVSSYQAGSYRGYSLEFQPNP